MSLKKSYRSFFKIGAAIPAGVFENHSVLEHILMEYNSITCENDMKPESLLDAQKNQTEPEKYDKCPAVTFDKIVNYMDFAQDNGLGVRGHTLLWHNQTPRWFFTEGYSVRENAPLASRETMLARMENYIRTVLEYIQQRWPEVIYAWDVVNEAVDNGGLRESLWTQTVGKDFFLHAFRFARKYADRKVSLFYNDYSTFIPWKREAICKDILNPLLEEKLIDGMGMQSHFDMDTDLNEYQDGLYCFGALPLQIQITELDIHNADLSEASMKLLAEKYKKLFHLFLEAVKQKKADITGVTFWGIHDDMSWLTGFRGEKSYPLLFDGQLRPKMAYDFVLQAVRTELHSL